MEPSDAQEREDYPLAWSETRRATRPLRYLGMIGSRAKVTRVYDALLAEGVPADALRKVSTPRGRSRMDLPL